MSAREDSATGARRQAMLSALEEQLDSTDTPAVKAHYDRLLALGHSDAEVRELMATVLAFYFWHTARKDDYSYDDYVAELAKLPKIDWKDDTSADGTPDI
jgi:hypothetical protein